LLIPLGLFRKRRVKFGGQLPSRRVDVPSNFRVNEALDVPVEDNLSQVWRSYRQRPK
jgi:hypothetical protein